MPWVAGAEALAATNEDGPLALADSNSLHVHFDRGYEYYQEGEYERSIEYFDQVTSEDAAYVDEERGPATYWYGRALEALDRHDDALIVWDAGLQVIEPVNLWLLDAFVRSVFEQEVEEYYPLAAQRYLNIIEHVGKLLDASDEERIGTHMEELCLVLPEEVMEEVYLQGCALEVSSPRIDQEAGKKLITWWNSENTAFATPRNERLEEHLSRVAYAREHYTHNGEFDDRAKIYIRFGPPERSRVIRFDDIRGIHRNHQLSMLVGQGFDGRRNEFWIYPGVEHSAHFLFIYSSRHGYQISGANDLIPRGLRGSMRRATDAVTVMEHVYRQLALHHIDYSSTYNEVANYSDQLAMAEFSGSPLPMPPSSFVQSTLGRAQNEDFQINRRRTERIPEAATNIHRHMESLDLSVRTARFLEADGTTRTEVYWAAAIDDLYPNRNTRRMLRRQDIDDFSEGYVIESTLVKLDEDYVHKAIERYQHRLGPLEEHDEGGILTPLTYSIHVDEPVYKFGVQWDQYQVYEDEDTEELKLGPQIKVQQFEANDLEPLSNDPAQLEMSDLKPLWILNDDAAAAEMTDLVYPYSDITAETNLALYFEIYHLEPDEDEERRFSVEYEVDRVAVADVRRMIRGDRRDRTTVRTDYVHDEATAEEYIVLDLVQDDFIGEIIITLRVTDEVSGQQVERELPLRVIDPTRPERRW